MTRRLFLKFTAAMGVLFGVPAVIERAAPMPWWEQELREHASPGIRCYANQTPPVTPKNFGCWPWGR